MPQEDAYTRKSLNFQAKKSGRGRGRLQEVVVYYSFQL